MKTAFEALKFLTPPAINDICGGVPAGTLSGYGGSFAQQLIAMSKDAAGKRSPAAALGIQGIPDGNHGDNNLSTVTSANK